MMIIATYLLVFAVGPALFWVLARQNPQTANFFCLAIGALVLVGFAYVIPRGASEAWQNWDYFGLIIVLTLWLAWIAVVALCVLAVRRRITDGRIVRGAMSFGAIATTLPWFGLHLAQMVTK